jgi:hypothetical protein
MDHAIDLVAPIFRKVWLRGDTDFALTSNFDRWDEKAGFVFGYDAKKSLVDMAEALPKGPWEPLQRPARYEVKTEEWRHPENVKEEIRGIDCLFQRFPHALRRLSTLLHC